MALFAAGTLRRSLIEIRAARAQFARQRTCEIGRSLGRQGETRGHRTAPSIRYRLQRQRVAKLAPPQVFAQSARLELKCLDALT